MMEQASLEADAVAKKIGFSNPLADTFYGADPYAITYNGRVYLYMTNDSQQFDATEKNTGGLPKADNSYDKIATIKVISSTDMVNWTDHGEIPVAGKNSVDNPLGIAKWANNAWAPAVAYKRIEGKDRFFLYFADNGNGIGVLEADSPTGPFREPASGSQLVPRGSQGAENVIWLFDPAVLVDDDGSGYLYYGGGIPDDHSQTCRNHPGTARVMKLKDNMVETDGDALVIDAPGLFEDSGIHKYNGRYYYTYCSNFNNNLPETGNGNICAMVSDNPMGPFTFMQQVFANPVTFFGVGGNNHHCIFPFHDKWYITYHAQTLGKALGSANGYRSTHIDELTYAEDGTIHTVTGTMEGVKQLKTLNPFLRIEAETIAWQSGIHICCTEGRRWTAMRSNSWIAIANADFGRNGSARFTACAAAKTGGILEIRLNTVSNPPAAVLTVSPTGGSDIFRKQTWDVDGITGVHNVFFVFKGDATGDPLKLDYYQFDENSRNGRPFRE